MTDYGALKHPAGKAHDHPAYDGAVRSAVLRAWEARLESTSPKGFYPPQFGVYFDGLAMYVRDIKAIPPENATLVCIAQFFGDRTVGVRFNGAHTEWVNF